MFQNLHRFVRRSRRRGPIVAALAVAAAICLGAVTEAQAVPRILRPGTRPWVFIGGIGFTGGVFGSGYGGTYYARRSYISGLHQFKLMEDIGGHFSGDAEGPALGASFEQSFGNGYWKLQGGPKFWWDIQPVSDLGLYIAPEVRIGPGVWGGWGSERGFLNTQIGCSGRLILGDRGIVFFKPFTMDLATDFDWYAGFWDVMAGGGVTW